MIPKKEFARRRKRVMDMMDERSIGILPAAPIRRRNRDIEFAYRPDSDFHYMTGFPEPEAVAVLVPGRPQGEYLLFCRERNPERELWDGARAGLEGACERYDANDAFPIGDIDDILPGLIENRERVFYAMGCYPEFDERVLGWVRRIHNRSRAGINSPAFVALDHLLHELRLYKSKAEIRAMQKAAQISTEAHRRVMSVCRPGMTEYQIEAEFLHECMRSGSRYQAYPSIVAGGANGCVLHYVANSDALKDGDLLLIDAGAEYAYYASDITRTFPVSGRFSAEQRAIYEVVLEAQLAAIDRVRAGNQWNHPHQAAVRKITEGLVELGLLKGKVDRLIEKGDYGRFFVHRTGHWIGMDVHDVGDYKVDGEWRILEPGMVTTIEPGIYIQPDDKSVARKWRGIGVRIEDDVLVTRGDPEILTEGAPKSVDEVEAFMSRDR